MSVLSGFQKVHPVKERVVYYISVFISNNSILRAPEWAREQRTDLGPANHFTSYI